MVMMNRIVFFMLALLFVACARTPEDKALALIREEVKESLCHLDSYEAAETVVDSAFSPKDDPVFFDKTLKVCRYAMEVEKYARLADQAERDVNIWKSVSGFEYKKSKAKKELADARRQIDRYTDKIQKVSQEMKAITDSGRRFIGFKVTHRFRFRDNSDNVVMGEKVFITDKELTKVLAGYDTHDQDWLMVQALYQGLEEEEAEEYFDVPE